MDQRQAFEIVVACDSERGIGFENKLPWHLPKDMKHFRELTSAKSAGAHQNFVIMGKNTWLSLPERFRPLPNRRNIVLSRTLEPSELQSSPESNVRICRSLNEALDFVAKHRSDERCFVIGGAKVYEQALAHPCCSRLNLTQISAKFDCDAFFPEFENSWHLFSPPEEQVENGVSFSFRVYERSV